MAESVRNGPWVLSMRWQDLLFAHWRVDASVLRRWVPSGLELDLCDGEAWLGVVPFQMSGVRPRFTPPIPGISAFPELNLRTYVRANGQAGVWFFSLDAASRLAVRMARTTFHLPYFDAAMRCDVASNGSVTYASRRTHRHVVPAELRVRYRPVGPVFSSRPGTLDHWLTERYCLYSADAKGRLYRGDIAHAPWPLQSAQVDLDECRMTGLLGIDLPPVPEHVLYARTLDVRAWWLTLVGRP